MAEGNSYSVTRHSLLNPFRSKRAKVVFLVVMFAMSLLLGITVLTPASSEISDTGGCLDDVVSVVPGGRFGNQFMEYASALAVSRQYQLQLVLPGEIARAMRAAFEGEREPAVDEYLAGRADGDGRRCYPRYSEARLVRQPRRWDTAARRVDWGASGGPIVLPIWIILPGQIALIAKDLRKRLVFREQYRKMAQDSLMRVSKAMEQPHQKITYVGLHARRGDYSEYLKSRWNEKPVDEAYFVRALARMREALAEERAAGAAGAAKSARSPLAVVVVSDDMPWAMRVLAPALRQDAQRRQDEMVRVFTPGSGRLMDGLNDLALLAACNHTIISYGTYSLTAAILAGGYTVAHYMENPDYHGAREIARILPTWIIVK